MKREILFKAKRIDNGQWIQGNLLELWTPLGRINFNYGIVPLDSHFCGDGKTPQTIIDVDTETVCQFTGLLDKNGNKIFEGDKIRFKNFRGVNGMKQSEHDGWIEGFEGFIAWSNYSGWELVKDNDHNSNILKAKKYERESRKCNLIITNANICSFEPQIIGNIHD